MSETSTNPRVNRSPSRGRNRALRLVPAAVVLLAALLFPSLVGFNAYWIAIALEVGIYLLVAYGVNLLFGYCGVPFLGMGALIAVGSYGTAILMTAHGWSFWTATLVCIPVVVLGGAAIALPSLRVSAWYFALISLSVNQIVQGLVTEWDFTGGFTGIVGIAMPTIGTYVLTLSDLLYVVVALNVVVVVLMSNAIDSRFGRALIAMRDSEEAAASIGVHTVGLRMVAFAVLSALCSIAGSFLSVVNQIVAPADFSVTFAIFFLVAVVVGGAGTKWGPLLGVLVFFAVPEFLDFLASWQQLVYGVVLLLLMIFAPKGLVGVVTDLASRTGLTRPRSVEPVEVGSPAETHDEKEGSGKPVLVESELESRDGGLVLDGICKSFGGVRVLDELSLTVPDKSIYAIVGPNGSGKTTTLNVISGFYQPDSGTVTLGGEGITGRPGYAVARMGVARTFQTPRILEQLDGLDNVLIGAYRDEKASMVEVLLNTGRARRERKALRARAHSVLRLLGADEVAATLGSEIPHGQRRLVEVARAIMSESRILLLDEPAAGLSPNEISQLTAALRTVSKLGMTVVLIEHHVDMVIEIADCVAVIDRGRVIAEDTPAVVFSQPEVMSAYMGV
ncbi:MAG: branched chain amino acid family transporter [Marmoricola sp.]|nr:branched chain amino acid family transporter [Marmoricola sp.]